MVAGPSGRTDRVGHIGRHVCRRLPGLNEPWADGLTHCDGCRRINTREALVRQRREERVTGRVRVCRGRDGRGGSQQAGGYDQRRDRRGVVALHDVDIGARRPTVTA